VNSYIIGNLFISNTAKGNGGALYLQGSSSQNSELFVINNTFYNNLAFNVYGKYSEGNAVYCMESVTEGCFYNNIFWENAHKGPYHPGDEFCIEDSLNNIYFYNNYIERGYADPYYSPGYSGNNINDLSDAEVGFVNPSENDLHLRGDSHLINKGLYPLNSADSLISCLYTEVDFDGTRRIVRDTIDMGAYEYNVPGIKTYPHEIDFGYVPHDRKETKDLVIKNTGYDNLTDISITFPGSIAEYYTINPDDIPEVMSPNDSICIPIEFCCHKMFVHCDDLITITSSDPYMPEVQLMVCGSPALDNNWNWLSFPELQRNEDGEQEAEEVLEPLEPDAIQVLSQEGEMIWETDSWTHNNLENFNSTKGYKLEMSNAHEFYPFSIVGDSISIIPPDTEIELYAGQENWIGYWLPETQDCDEAFGEHWDKVISIRAENWYYHKPFQNPTKFDPPESEPAPSSRIRPLHYGRGYIVRVEEDIPNFHWNNSSEPASKFDKKETEYFYYEEKANYEVIDVIDIDESILEIGVFEDGECKGATVVDSSAEQILVYSGGLNKNDSELSFQIITEKGEKAMLVENYRVYDPEVGTFVESKLIAGKQDYSLVHLYSPSTSSLKFSLFQNYPNPFSGSTVISFSIPQNIENAEIKIYNIKGQLVKSLGYLDFIKSKTTDFLYSISWDGKNENGKPVSSGIYFYRLEAGDKTFVKKMVIIR
jgi:predicted outer membrane repeat protein